MTCYYPKKAWRVGKTENGKPRYKITEYNVDHLETFDDEGKPLYLMNADQWIEVPCGKCIGCRLDYSRSWAQRCMMEAQYHEFSYFVTLTYDDEHLSLNDYGIPTLRKSDFQEFMKSLRQAYPYDNKLRYFCAGEYGSKEMRPHYHALIFGLKLDDLKVYSQNKLGDNLYNSEWLSKIWEKGHVVIGEVTYKSAGYTARYVTKKVNEDLSVLMENIGLQPEFTLMSRKPGIAAWYFRDHPDIMQHKHFYLSSDDGSIKCTPSRYFKRLLERVSPSDDIFVENETNNALLSDSRRQFTIYNTNYDYLEELKVKEANKLKQIKILKRSDCYEKTS